MSPIATSSILLLSLVLLTTKSVFGAQSASSTGTDKNGTGSKPGSGTGSNSIQPQQRQGPHFDSAASKNVTALLGKTAYLNCRVKNLGNKTGKPVDVVFLDWQMARLGSPALDVCYIIFSSGNEECLHNSQDFFTFYNNLNPFNCYKEHLMKYGKFGLMFSLLIILFATAVTPQQPEQIMSDILQNSKLIATLNPLMSKRVALIVKASCEINII